MPRALFVVDDRPESGLGHVVRSGALSQELSGRGWDCPQWGWNDLGAIAQWDVIIVDGRWEDVADEHAYFDAIANLVPSRIVYICDTPCDYEVDLIVNGSAGAGAIPNLYAGNFVAGPEYALLRRLFRAFRGAWRGGSGVIDLRTIKRLGLSPGGVIATLQHADVAISHGGMRALEAACIGTPLVLIEDNPTERVNIEGLFNAGAALVLDPEEVALLGPDRAQVTAKGLLKQPEKLRAMSKAGSALVDGRGCERVADAIEALIQ